MEQGNEKLTVDQKLDAIYVSVEKTRKMFLMIVWITVLAIVLPMVGFALVVPKFLESYKTILDVL